MALPEIVIPITADADGVKTGVSAATRHLEKLEGISDKLARSFQVGGDKLTRWGKNMSYVSAGIAAAATAAFALTKNVADMGDKIANASKAAGVSTDYYQEMAFAVGQVADVTEDEFGDSLVKITRKLGEAKEGSKSALAAFEAIGISQAEIASGAIDTEAAYTAFLATMGQTTDQATAAALATDLFGKSGARMGGLLAGSTGEIAGLRDRARELGIVMSGEGVAASEAFGDKWEELTRSVGGLQIKIADALLPVLVGTLIPALTDTVIPALSEVAGWIGNVITWFGDMPAPVQEAATVIATAFAVGGPVLLALGAAASFIGTMVAASGPIGLLLGAAALLSAAWVQWGDEFKTAVGGAVDWVTQKFDAFIGKLKSIITWAEEVGAAVSDAFWLGEGEMKNGDSFSEDVNWSEGGGSGGSQSTGSNVAEGLAEGVATGLEANRAGLEAAFGTVTEMARTAYDTHSPSRVFHEIGTNIGQGLADGIAATGGLTTAALDAIAKSGTSITAGMVGDVLGSLGELFKGSKAFAIGQAIVAMWQGAAEALKLPFPANIAAFAKTAAMGATALSNIKAAQPGGGGAGGVGGSSSAGAAAPAPAQNTANVTWIGEPSAKGFKSLTEQLNAEFRQGYTLNINFQQA